jgi:hypothetical protein
MPPRSWLVDIGGFSSNEKRLDMKALLTVAIIVLMFR